MKAVRSAESVRIRRELAQLLRRLRAIRKDKLSHDELAGRVNGALAEAASIRRFVTITNAPETGGAVCGTCLARVDKGKLSEAGFARPEVDAARQPEDRATGCP